MFQRILILLDGSERAELALPVVARMARTTGASLTLLRMMTLPADYTWYKLEPPFCDRDILSRERRNASTYLKSKAWELEMAGIPVHIYIIPALPLHDIHAFIESQHIDLVVMCSRGQISVRPRIQRSMAQQILQQSSAPVLILQEIYEQSGTLYPRNARPVRIMVPLDGSVLAETALAPAAYLAAALSAPEHGQLHLVSVLPFSDIQKNGEVSRFLKQRARNHLQAYLHTTGQALHEGAIGQLQLSVTTSVLIHPDVAEAIVRVAEMKQQGIQMAEAEAVCDIIALTTHGRSGLQHLRIGSTAECILQRTHLPFLVVHPPLAGQKENRARSTALASP